MSLSLFLLLIVSICLDESRAEDASPCGDWEPFNQELCYKILDKTTFHSYSDAEKLCQSRGSTLLNILSKPEQDFLNNYIFSVNKVVDNVWIGARGSDGYRAYRWEDGTFLKFTNWQIGSPKSTDADYCVQLNPDDGKTGQWIDEPCVKKALVVCQKEQVWSIAQIQKVLRQVASTVAHDKVNPIPVGFVYVQLPNEPAPEEIWSGMTWTDISSGFEGLFFRVGGKNAAAFGTIQEESSPRLTNVTATHSGTFEKGTIKITPGVPSAQIITGNYGGNDPYELSFTVSAGEVRPRNMAIKIWKRTKD